MNKTRMNKIILGITIFILILLIIFIYIFNNDKSTDIADEVPDDMLNSEFTDIDSKVIRVNIRNDYYYINNCVNKFYSLLNKNNIENNDLSETKEYLYSLLGSEYITENGITVENVLNYFTTNNNATFNITDMYVTQRSFDMSVYFIYGKVRENGKNSDFSIMIEADRTNKTFKVYPKQYMDRYSNIEVGNNIDIQVPEHINDDGYNTFEFRNISNDMHAEELFENLKNYLLYDNETLYERLSAEYRANFNNYQEFYNFISTNYLKLIKMKYNGYNKLNEDDMKEIYLFKDESGSFEFELKETNPFYYEITIKNN